MMKFSKKIKAFTLAEVLMVLGIIGVVAAVTIPNLKDSTDEQVYVAKAQKVYSEMETAYTRMVTKEGNPVNWSIADFKIGEVFSAKMAPYLDVVQDCGNVIGGVNASAMNGASLILKDGSMVVFDFHPTGVSDFTSGNTALKAMIDVDGPSKGPNTIGQDCFYFFIRPNVLETKIDPGYEEVVANANPSANSYLAWVLKYSNMDYNRCSSNLNWYSANTSCN